MARLFHWRVLPWRTSEGTAPANCELDSEAVLIAFNLAVDSAFVRAVAGHLDLCSRRQAIRNQHHQFLPSAHADDAFGVPHVFSTLKRQLQSMGKTKAATDQWQRTIENFQKKGLRSEELECSKLMPELATRGNDGHQLTALELANLCDFKDLRLSVIPVVSDALRQLRFTGPTARKLVRTNLSKAVAVLPRSVVKFDPFLAIGLSKSSTRRFGGQSTVGRPLPMVAR